jgi:YEATS domain-containing protein 4
LYYVTESGEKPQTLYHHLRLHPYGRTEAEKEAMRNGTGEVRAWVYEEQLFNEPYESFYEILTSGAHPKGHPGGAAAAGGGGKGKGKGKSKSLQLPEKTKNVVWERSALIPLQLRPGQPFSRETEQLEVKKLAEAQTKVLEMSKKMQEELKKKEELLAKLKAENSAAPAGTAG